MIPSNHLIFCHPLLLLPSNLSYNQGLFQCISFLPSGGQSIGASASASFLPMNIQDWFPLGLTGLISLLSKGLSRVFYNTPVQKHQFFYALPLSSPTLTSGKWREIIEPLDESEKISGKTIALTRWTFVGKMMSLLFNMLSRLVIVFLPRRKHLLI